MTNSPSGPRCFWTASLVAGFVPFLFIPLLVSAQQSPSPSAKTSVQEPSSEMEVSDKTSETNLAEAAKIHVNVRLIQVRVVVRNGTGHAVGGLHKEDFEIFDDGKKQEISNFDAEISSPPAATGGKQDRLVTGEMPPSTSSIPFPTHYVAYVFDDLRLTFGDLARVRDAAERQVSQLAPTDRVAIFSTTGTNVLDFTDDRERVHEVLKRLRPRPLSSQNLTDCPDINLYMADQIVNKHDRETLQMVVNDYIICAPVRGPNVLGVAFPQVLAVARQMLILGQEDSRMALRVMNDVARRMSTLPGRRDMVLISPGFLTPELEYDYEQLIDRALRVQVVINSLDARGLYTTAPFGDISKRGPADPSSVALRTELDMASASRESDILSVLAYSTGGVFFQNNNDMDEGFRRVSDSPEFYYVLGFTPQNLKSDGHFHSIKVNLTNHQKYDVQARRGYYAPRRDMEATEEAKREIEDEVFSSEELHDLPVALHTEFFKPSDDSAKLTVLARVDVKRLRYKQSNDRNLNDLTVVTAVFDRNGNFVKADQKLVQMRWKNETLQGKLASGITLKTSFDVKPGRYLVRIVARDTEQQVMSAENGAVEIP